MPGSARPPRRESTLAVLLRALTHAADLGWGNVTRLGALISLVGAILIALVVVMHGGG